MVAITDLISVWQRAWSASPTEQALSLLIATSPSESPQRLAELPIGTRDKRLIQLREQLFGEELALLVDCPQCETQVELELTTNQIQFADKGQSELLHSISSEGFVISFRVPNSLDLMAVSRSSDIDTRSKRLLQRCVESACRGEQTLKLAEIPDGRLREVIDAMDAADPQANVEIPVQCVDCKHKWCALFDIVTHLWAEIDARVRQTLNEIHLIASTYGWSESTILDLPPGRRQLYVSMVRQ